MHGVARQAALGGILLISYSFLLSTLRFLDSLTFSSKISPPFHRPSNVSTARAPRYNATRCKYHDSIHDPTAATDRNFERIEKSSPYNKLTGRIAFLSWNRSVEREENRDLIRLFFFSPPFLLESIDRRTHSWCVREFEGEAGRVLIYPTKLNARVKLVQGRRGSVFLS